MELSDADKIWNRACGYYDGTVNDKFAGDLALRALLSLHGPTMNGGVFHPFDVLSEDEIAEALRGYRYFGLDAIAELFLRAKALIDSGADFRNFESALDLEYDKHVPDDQKLVDIFKLHLAANPQLYAPL